MLHQRIQAVRGAKHGAEIPLHFRLWRGTADLLQRLLRELNESAEKAEVVRVSGEAPEQNGGY